MSKFIKQTLIKVNREHQHTTPMTNFTSKTLKSMNVTQLQIVINEIYEFRGILNEALMKNLMERDELLSKRDGMLMTIEQKVVNKNLRKSM